MVPRESTPRDSVLGPCPCCGEPVAEVDVLIRYEFDGEPAVWAACSDCRNVVDPLRGAGDVTR